MKSVLALLFLFASVHTQSDGGTVIDMMMDSVKDMMGTEGTFLTTVQE